jgi:hypothetical protein
MSEYVFESDTPVDVICPLGPIVDKNSPLNKIPLNGVVTIYRPIETTDPTIQDVLEAIQQLREDIYEIAAKNVGNLFREQSYE